MFADPAAPGGGESIKWATLLNTLVIINVHAYENNIQTSMGVSEAVRADVYCVDGPAAPDTYSDTLIFPKVLRSQLSSNIGQQVLGRIGQGPAQPGKNPAWILNPATEADKQLAVQAWTQIQAGQFVNPTAPQQAAPQQVAHNPWAVNAQPAAPAPQQAAPQQAAPQQAAPQQVAHDPWAVNAQPAAPAPQQPVVQQAPQQPVTPPWGAPAA